MRLPLVERSHNINFLTTWEIIKTTNTYTMPYILNANSQDLDGQMRLRDNEKKFDKEQLKRRRSQASQKSGSGQFRYGMVLKLKKSLIFHLKISWFFDTVSYQSLDVMMDGEPPVSVEHNPFKRVGLNEIYSFVFISLPHSAKNYVELFLWYFG